MPTVFCYFACSGQTKKTDTSHLVVNEIQETKQDGADPRGDDPEDVDVLEPEDVHVLAEDGAAHEDGQMDDAEDEAVLG